jgi:hypothetical protein
MPPHAVELMAEDELLVCMRSDQKALFEANINNHHVLDYLLTGVEPARGAFFRWLEQKEWVR